MPARQRGVQEEEVGGRFWDIMTSPHLCLALKTLFHDRNDI